MVRNRYGVKVKVMCASCGHKKVTRSVTQRYCTFHKKNVRPEDVCPFWEMSGTLQKVGRMKGVVIDKNTKEIILN